MPLLLDSPCMSVAQLEPKLSQVLEYLTSSSMQDCTFKKFYQTRNVEILWIKSSVGCLRSDTSRTEACWTCPSLVHAYIQHFSLSFVINRFSQGPMAYQRSDINKSSHDCFVANASLVCLCLAQEPGQPVSHDREDKENPPCSSSYKHD